VISKSGCFSVFLCGFSEIVMSTSNVSEAIQPVKVLSFVRVIVPSSVMSIFLLLSDELSTFHGDRGSPQRSAGEPPRGVDPLRAV
jgi:hypothetical protein